MARSATNVLLITTDTQRCDTLACMGNAQAISPHLDRLAAEGVLYEQAHTSSPVCSPARCTLLTGVHAPVHGAIENGIRRHEHLTVFPDLLKRAGYTNIMIGKTHFGPLPASFDVHRPYHDGPALDAAPGGFDPDPDQEARHREARIVDVAITEIDRVTSSGAGPFFAFCSLVSPHPPFQPPGRWARAYQDRPLPPVNYRPGEEERHPAHIRSVLGLLDGNPASTAFRNRHDVTALDGERRLYYGLAAYCDDQIGRLLAHLDRTGLRETTLVIFTSDHGTQLLDHGFLDKHNYYDESWRVPLIMRQPGRLPAGERRGFASWVDLAPTILGAAGISCPTMQGLDLLHPGEDGGPPPRRCAAATLYKSCAVTGRRWKMEYYMEEGRGRLFDRREDGTEQVDLWDSRAHRQVRDALLHALLTWRADMLDLQQLQAMTVDAGGPIAKHTARHTHALLGSDAERRLDEAVARIEQ